MPLPLEGIKVLDFTRFLAGPFCPVLLGYMGAEVIKVEPPEGETVRYWGPFFKGEGRSFLGWNPNKKSLVLDLTRKEGREIAEKLAREADVVVENFRPGTTERLGIDYEMVKSDNPGVIYCSVSGYGQTGPSAEKPGFDPLAQALGGIMSRHGREEGVPLFYRGAPTDYGSAMLAAYGVMLALYVRKRTGMGQKIEASLLSTVVALQAGRFIASDHDDQITTPGGLVPYGVFETNDRDIFLGIEAEGWPALCKIVGLEHLLADPRFSTNEKRVEHRKALLPLLEEKMREKPAEEWLTLFHQQGIICAPVNTLEEFASDPQVIENEMIAEVDHATIGKLKMLNVPVNLSSTPGKALSPAPVLGQHTDEILTRLGYKQEEIKELRGKKVIL
ncbi:MAG: CoA transferase [Candidatus Tectomicrobia bacterium]|nr:CoA transferase [Candidatus Tectomicrobia bacterium]